MVFAELGGQLFCIGYSDGREAARHGDSFDELVRHLLMLTPFL